MKNLNIENLEKKMTDFKPPQTFEEWRVSILYREVYQTVWSLAAEAFAAGVASRQAEIAEINDQLDAVAKQRDELNARHDLVHSLKAQLAEKEAEFERLKQIPIDVARYADAMENKESLARYEALVEAARECEERWFHKAHGLHTTEQHQRHGGLAVCVPLLLYEPLKLRAALAGLEKKP